LDRWLRIRMVETRHFEGEGAIGLRRLQQLLALPADYP